MLKYIVNNNDTTKHWTTEYTSHCLNCDDKCDFLVSSVIHQGYVIIC